MGALCAYFDTMHVASFRRLAHRHSFSPMHSDAKQTCGQICDVHLQTSGPGLATPLPQALAAQRKAANPRERAGNKPGADVEYP